MRGYTPFLGEVPLLGQRGVTLLGQARIMPPGLPPPVFPNPDGTCPEGRVLTRLADQTVCVVSSFYAVASAGVHPSVPRGPLPPQPQIQPPIEYPPQPISDIGPLPPPVETPSTRFTLPGGGIVTMTSQYGVATTGLETPTPPPPPTSPTTPTTVIEEVIRPSVVTPSRRFFTDDSGVIRLREPSTEGVEGCPAGWVRDPVTGRCLPPTPSTDRSRLPGGLLTAAAFGGFGGGSGIVAPMLGSPRFRVVNLR